MRATVLSHHLRRTTRRMRGTTAITTTIRATAIATATRAGRRSSITRRRRRGRSLIRLRSIRARRSIPVQRRTLVRHHSTRVRHHSTRLPRSTTARGKPSKQMKLGAPLLAEFARSGNFNGRKSKALTRFYIVSNDLAQGLGRSSF